MGQKNSTTNVYNTTNVVKGDNNSVVPSTSTTNKVSPSQSISPSTSLSVARKASGDLNPTDCSPGVVSVNNKWRDYAQTLISGSKTALSHISRTVNSLTGSGASVKESLDNINAINTGAANNLAIKLSDVIRDSSHDEVTSKLKLLDNGGSTGMFGGVYNVSDNNLSVERNTTMERINSTPNTVGISPMKMSLRAEIVYAAFLKLRSVMELLSRPLNTYFSPDVSELNQRFPGTPYELVGAIGDASCGFNVPPDDETVPSESNAIAAYFVSLTIYANSTAGGTVSPIINTHTTNKISSTVAESGPMRIAGQVAGTDSQLVTYYVEFLLNRQAVSISFPTEITPVASFFETTVIDVSELRLNVPSDRVEGISITDTTTGLDCLGRISGAGASTGPGDIRSLWHEGTIGIATLTKSITSHTAYPEAKASLMKELTRVISIADEPIEQLAEDMMSQVPLYMYVEGPIGRLFNYGVSNKDVTWLVFVTLNLLDSLATSHTYAPDPAALAYGNRVAALAASRPASYSVNN